MAHSGPSFAVPSCASAPVVGYGSPGLHHGGLHSAGWGRSVTPGMPAFAIPSTVSAPVAGFGSGSLTATGVPSASLGVLSGVEPSFINQTRTLGVVIQPPPVIVFLPGPTVSVTGLPAAVRGNRPCAVSYGGSVIGGGGFRSGLSGGQPGSSLGCRGSIILGRRGSNCIAPL